MSWAVKTMAVGLGVVLAGCAPRPNADACARPSEAEATFPTGKDPRSLSRAQADETVAACYRFNASKPGESERKLRPEAVGYILIAKCTQQFALAALKAADEVQPGVINGADPVGSGEAAFLRAKVALVQAAEAAEVQARKCEP